MNTREQFDAAFATLPAPDITGSLPVSQQITAYLTKYILNAALSPGTALSEGKLCAFFDVSRQPVREALLRLSVAGLVQVYSQRGSVVSLISVADVRRAQFIREVIEVEAVKRAIERGSPHLLDALMTEIELQRTFQSHSDTDRFYASDENFHQIIAEHSGIVGLWQELTTLKAQLDRVRQLQLRDDHNLDTLIDQHVNIVKAVEARAPEFAAQAMSMHLRRVTSDLEATVAALPHFFRD